MVACKIIAPVHHCCKLWQSIISNPQFIDTHVANSQKKQARVAFLTNEEDPVNIDIISTHEEFVTLTVPPQCRGMTRHTFSYNGLICLTSIYRLNICACKVH